MFGELDSNPLIFEQKTRLENMNLFDISNLAANGKTILKPTDIRFKFEKVEGMEQVADGRETCSST